METYQSTLKQLFVGWFKINTGFYVVFMLFHAVFNPSFFDGVKFENYVMAYFGPTLMFAWIGGCTFIFASILEYVDDNILRPKR